MYNWFYIFNAAEFLATGLVSRTYTLNLQGLGQKEILVTLGNHLAITYDGVFLPLQLNGVAAFKIDDRAIYKNADDNVFLGIKVVE